MVFYGWARAAARSLCVAFSYGMINWTWFAEEPLLGEIMSPDHDSQPGQGECLVPDVGAETLGVGRSEY
jgi:hypothetical protein